MESLSRPLVTLVVWRYRAKVRYRAGEVRSSSAHDRKRDLAPRRNRSCSGLVQGLTWTRRLSRGYRPFGNGMKRTNRSENRQSFPSRRQKNPQLWGLDQEFLGSPKFILEQILETQPGPQAEAIAQKLQAQCSVDTQKSIASGGVLAPEKKFARPRIPG